MEQTPPYELRIRPNRNWVRFDWQGLWQYRDLLFLLVRRDFVSRYKQTVLGPAWFVIQPLLMTGVFTVIFGRVARIPTDGIPPVLFYLCGLLGWTYFAQNFQSTSTTLLGNASLFRKVYFPRLILPLSSVCSNLFAFAIQLATFLGFYACYKFFTGTGDQFGLRWEALALPLIVVQIALFSLGVGLWLSALTVKYRDFQHLSAFLIQIWMYATPVIYPLSNIPERWRWLSILNPMTMPVELIKHVLLGSGAPEGSHLVISVAGTLLTLLSGLLIFQKVERTFVDTV
jgi:lipopolysaccharide transport system permease protein